MKHTIRALTFIVIGLAVVSCTKREPAGPIVTEYRSISNYDELEVRGDFDIQIDEDFTYDLELTAPKNKMAFIDTYVLGNKLIIAEDDNRIHDSRMTLKLSNQHLNNIQLVGSGRIDGDTIFAQNLDVDLVGSGRIEIPVHTDELNLVISGSGSIETFGLSDEVSSQVTGSGHINTRSVEAVNGTARIEGSGNIRIYASDTLFARITGSGNIQYWGNPTTLNTNIDGSGQITDMQ